MSLVLIKYKTKQILNNPLSNPEFKRDSFEKSRICELIVMTVKGSIMGKDEELLDHATTNTEPS